MSTKISTTIDYSNQLERFDFIHFCMSSVILSVRLNQGPRSVGCAKTLSNKHAYYVRHIIF